MEDQCRGVRYGAPFAAKPAKGTIETPALEHTELWERYGKEEINALVWKWLPDTTTLREAEKVAAEIHALIDIRLLR